ncbi:MAG: hypothetical protein OXF31_02065 [Gammaproteobacteria bacterium]|nr:hypothetical protein [Gammaproteobacteria bacterium]
MTAETINLLIALVTVVLAIVGTGVAIAVVVTKIFEKSVDSLRIENASIQKAVAAGAAEHKEFRADIKDLRKEMMGLYKEVLARLPERT